jgi:hypothetical protein
MFCFKVPAMGRRVVTPYSDPPDMATLESLDTDLDEAIQWQASKDGSSKKNKSKRRRSRNKSISVDIKGRERMLSVASDVSLEDYSSEPTSPRSDIEQVCYQYTVEPLPNAVLICEVSFTVSVVYSTSTSTGMFFSSAPTTSIGSRELSAR